MLRQPHAETPSPTALSVLRHPKLLATFMGRSCEEFERLRICEMDLTLCDASGCALHVVAVVTSLVGATLGSGP